MSEYKKWFRNQPEKFQKLIVVNPKKVKENFIDENYQAITLDQLKAMDEEYIFSEQDMDQ